MSILLTSTETLPDLILAAPRNGRRKLVALAGPPASGKTTLASKLAQTLIGLGHETSVVPMDGFHLDNQILSDMKLLHRKGSPDSFDAAGLLRLLPALRSEDTVIFPMFDRRKDISVAGAGQVGPDCDTVIIEGNYLLFDAPTWRDIAKEWDLSIMLEAPISTIEARLRHRWRQYGISSQEAERRIQENDLVNARQVAEVARSADVSVRLWASNHHS